MLGFSLLGEVIGFNVIYGLCFFCNVVVLDIVYLCCILFFKFSLLVMCMLGL